MFSIVLAGPTLRDRDLLGFEATLAGIAASLRRAIHADIRITAVTGSVITSGTCEVLNPDDIAQIKSAVKGSDLVLLVGSPQPDTDQTALSSITTDSGLALWTLMTLIASAHTVPLMAYDIDIPPMIGGQSQRAIAAILVAASRVTVRHSASAARARLLNIDNPLVTGDPAISLPIIDSVSDADTNGSGPILGVALQAPAADADYPHWVQKLSSIIDATLAATGGSAVFVPSAIRSPNVNNTPRPDDIAAAQNVAAAMRREDQTIVLDGTASWTDRANVLEGCDAVLAMRYHAALFALRSTVPTVGLSDDSSLSDLFTDWQLAGRRLPTGADVAQVTALLTDSRAGGRTSLSAVADLHAGGGAMVRREHAAALNAAALLGTKEPIALLSSRQRSALKVLLRLPRPQDTNEVLGDEISLLKRELGRGHAARTASSLYAKSIQNLAQLGVTMIRRTARNPTSILHYARTAMRDPRSVARMLKDIWRHG